MKNSHLLKVSRVEGLTDGLFATAMTVLVFSVYLPNDTTAANLTDTLTGSVLEVIFIYAGSFIILGTQWVKINILHGFLKSVNRPYLWVNILYLIPAGIVPFSTSVLIDYPENHVSIGFYVANLMLSNIIQILVWQCGAHYKLYNQAYTPSVSKALTYRMCMPFAFYISSLVVAHWNITIAFIILVIHPIFHILPGKLDDYLSTRSSRL